MEDKCMSLCLLLQDRTERESMKINVMLGGHSAWIELSIVLVGNSCNLGKYAIAFSFFN